MSDILCASRCLELTTGLAKSCNKGRLQSRTQKIVRFSLFQVPQSLFVVRTVPRLNVFLQHVWRNAFFMLFECENVHFLISDSRTETILTKIKPRGFTFRFTKIGTRKQKQSKQKDTTMSQQIEDWPLEDIERPLDTDVMCGRGRGTNFHPGNIRFREMVEGRKEEYRESTRIEKPLVSLNIVREWRAQSPPGRFLKLNKKTGKWHDVGDEKAREKTSQALREKPKDEQQQQEEEDSTTETNEPISQGDQVEETPRRELERPSLDRGHTLGSENLAPDDVDLENFEWVDGDGDNMGAVALQMEHDLSIDAIFPEILQPKDFMDGSGAGPAILHEILKKDDFTREYLEQTQRAASPVPFRVPAIPPRSGGEIEDMMKRHTSNEVFEAEPNRKRRAGFSRCRSAASNRLKQIFLHQVLKQEMCMEEFINIAMKSMGLGKCEHSEADEFATKAASMDTAGHGVEGNDIAMPQQATLSERTQSEEIEFDMLMKHDAV